MTVKELIDLLKEYPEDSPIAIKEKTNVNDGGFVHHSWEWVNLEKKHIAKPKIGNRIYIGSM